VQVIEPPSWLHSCGVEEESGSTLQVILYEERAGDSTEPASGGAGAATANDAEFQSKLDSGRRRFTWAAVIAIGLMAIPFVWILWSDWGPANPLRRSAFQDNFFDLQARAMFHGHLSLATGSLGIEGFVHDGRTYTYFGLFPSIIRMPILLVTSGLDGKLTPSSILVAWVLTGLFASLLLWRVRYLLRGDAVMGRTEAGAYGLLVATIMGGTVWMLLASIPFVFTEDIAWSICLTVGSMFALLGVVERPSWGRVAASGVLIMGASLDRATTGWACVLGAALVAIWFAVGRGGEENRRWFLPVLAAGLIPLAVGCAVNYAKFGVPFGVSVYEQVWTHVNAYRRKFLAANHSEQGVVYVPTNVITYFRPNGIGFSNVFPFVTLPSSPPTASGGVLFDRLYRTASIPASTPLLFLLSAWGLVTAFRPRSIGRAAHTRLLLVASGSAGAALMLWGYIAPRYLGDFVPFLVLASAVAMADLFRRLGPRSRTARTAAVACVAVVALFSVVANIGMAIVPNDEWTTTQALNYVDAQSTFSDLTGHPLQSHVQRGSTLPPWRPAGQLYVVGNCSGLYISNGENYSTVPSQQYQRTTWATVELGPPFENAFRLIVRSPPPRGSASLALLGVGRYTMVVHASTTRHAVRLRFEILGGASVRRGPLVDVALGTTHTVLVTTDRVKHMFSASIDGVSQVLLTVPKGEPFQVDSSVPTSPHTPDGVVVTPMPTPRPALCQSLIG
jgi:hypothetical protein